MTQSASAALGRERRSTKPVPETGTGPKPRLNLSRIAIPRDSSGPGPGGQMGPARAKNRRGRETSAQCPFWPRLSGVAPGLQSGGPRRCQKPPKARNLGPMHLLAELPRDSSGPGAAADPTVPNTGREWKSRPSAPFGEKTQGQLWAEKADRPSLFCLFWSP